MANSIQKTKAEMTAFKADIKSASLKLIEDKPGLRLIDLEREMESANPQWIDEFGHVVRKGVVKWSVLVHWTNIIISKMRKEGEVLQINKRYYVLGTDPATIPAPTPKSRKKTKKAPAKVEETPEVEVEETPEVEVEETPEVEVEETPEVEVEETPEVEVEETPEVEVEVIPEVETSTGAVKEITSTLLPVEETPEEVEEAPQETLEVQEVVEDSPEVEVAPEDNLDVLFGDDEEETQEVRYDLKALRNEFDPHKLTLKNGATGDFLVYRDQELRNWVVAQKGREDYLIIPVDVNPSRADFAKYGKIARKEFDEAPNHKKGSNILIRALISCKPSCQHTDDFAGFVEECANPDCPTHIWKGNVIYVNPNA